VAGGAHQEGTKTADAGARRRLSVAGVMGEVLVTVGAIVLLYVGWQLWFGDWIIGAQNDASGTRLSQQWTPAGAPATPAASPLVTPSASPYGSPGAAPTVAPVVLGQPGDGQVFGVLVVPRFGADYAVRIAGGVTRARTLDPIGIGHYPGTQMPGGVGNVALAAHRLTHGGSFKNLETLRVGDAVVIQTKDGWYTYRFRNLEYVKPTAVQVLDAVPQHSTTTDGERYLTMMTCAPIYSLAERAVAYSVFESFTPAAAGPPAALTAAGGS